MPLLDPSNPNVQFCVHVWEDDDDEDGVENYYATRDEAKAQFDKLESGGRFAFGGLYRWVGEPADWVAEDNFPIDWDPDSVL